MSGGSPSLLTFLPVPVAVGDPEGRAVYVNPSFQERFDVAPGEVRGRPLAEIFVGGAREAVLRATAAVCGEGRELRFRMRERERAYAVLAAPIEADGHCVGLLFLFWEEAVGEERLLAFQREIRGPIDELCQCLDAMLEQTGGRRAVRFRALVEEGIRAVERIRKWTDELAAVAAYAGSDAEAKTFDPTGLARSVGEAVAEPARAAGQSFELLLPAFLPAVRGDGDRLTLAFGRFVRKRVSQAPAGTAFTLTAKLLEADACVLLSLTEVVPARSSACFPEDDPEPSELERVIAPLGGAVVRVADPVAGVTTAIRLPVA